MKGIEMSGYIRFTLTVYNIQGITQDDIKNLPYVESVDDLGTFYTQVFISDGNISYNEFMLDIEKIRRINSNG